MPDAILADKTTDETSAVRPSMIKCIGASKIFRDFWFRPRVRAVEDLTMDVRQGEVFGLLGPNGSGKSTTIKMILGLLNPTAGRIIVFNKRPDDVRIKEQIGYLPEETYLYRFLNARETLDYYGRLFHQNGAVRKKRIDMLLDMVGLTHAARRPIGEYSKGMQRKIGLAQALINDPQLLILDEPTTGMDPIGARQVKNLIRELARRGKTVLLCSHLLADVEDVCDRVAIMFGGRLHAQGSVGELLTSQNTTTLTVPTMDEATQQAIIELLEARGVPVQRAEQPRQRLEDLFLDIVHRAQREGVQTAGSIAGGRLAQFLTQEQESRSAHLPEDIQTAEVIDELMTAAPTTKPPSASTPMRQTPAAQPDASLLESLTQTPTTKPTPASGSTPGLADDAKSVQPDTAKPMDRSVIDSLLDQPPDAPR